MKTIYNKLLVGLLMVALSFTMANSPLNAQKVAKGINYQAVLRDSENKFIADKNIKVTISILKKEINGELVWEETHNPTTNKVGIFTLVIGQGTRIKGYVSKFSDILWGTEEHLLKVVAEVDGKTIDFPASPMLSVPYAFFADSARVARADFSGVAFDPVSNTLKNSNAVIADLSPLRQSLEYDPASYHLSISGKPGIVDLRQFAHSPQDLRILNNKLWITGNKDSTVVDLSPYKQTLQVSSTSKLQISGGNEVQVDTSNVNEIQTLSRTGNKLSLSRNGGEVTIDASETNELQTLSKVNGALVLGNAPNGRAIPIDTSLNNEIQTIQRTGNKLFLSGTTTEVSVDDADADVSNELIGSITYNQNTRSLSILEGSSNSKTVNLTPQTIAFRASKSTNDPLGIGASMTLIFNNDAFNEGNGYDKATGIFTVPSNGAGIYIFYFNRRSNTTNVNFSLIIKNQDSQAITENLQPFLIKLNEGDFVYVKATATNSTFINEADFFGYKIN